ncbi:lactate utilization protein [Hymenobacter sp. BRD128]|uniref:LutC/YkgG family protein n=1 Tax=Hymenobacter sp. BRD128 TaxID=2675878 RepID=UPI00156682F6|nr:LUD domain-containing protein [Hymenobacter sp. BRD128]QKG55415.1 lactate utilization protein [Hymenobacter sp. BRD128]
MLSPREQLLGRIRSALAAGPAPAPPVPDWAAPVHPPLPAADLAVVFAENFRRIGGEFFYCETSAQLGAALRDWLAERLPAGQQFYVWEPAMQTLLASAKVPLQATAADFRTQAAVGLTSCEALVARTGSIVVAPATASGRRLSIYPDQHLVLARPSQVVAEIGDALRVVQARYSDHLPSMLSLTTGPSRTADIEKTLVLGAHGPRRLSLFLLEDDAETAA